MARDPFLDFDKRVDRLTQFGRKTILAVMGCYFVGVILTITTIATAIWFLLNAFK